MKITNPHFAQFSGFILLISLIIMSQCIQPNTPSEETSVKFTISAADLYDAFSRNDNNSGQKYINKIIEVSGPVASIQTDSSDKSVIFLLDDLFGIRCTMDSAYSASNVNRIMGLSPGEHIRLKGKCLGFQTDVLLSECIMLEINQLSPSAEE